MVRQMNRDDFIKCATQDSLDILNATCVFGKLIDNCYPEYSVETMAKDITEMCIKQAKKNGWVDREINIPDFWDFYSKSMHQAITKGLNDEIEKRGL